ncbi:RNA polymerase sigma-70 factor [Flagellimonas halotolerans]|uniref:RNA polymerase sigma-70 factor n=1 Tax=Flagellimonas halotolerans TaxID=3112164 RepID=A0ABU6IS49_9FLAO|nr:MULTISPECIES: RNA polymerase sigma-70 factor [unclassified Allomuricauda]MEC3966078.1 RNA polymerase sigma-70 factor [Muricauda sp. SYSU M86414]MEC4265812.1 RNA polymerase sigma-70 factor [Muricauda sp. SYSU M84420]
MKHPHTNEAQQELAVRVKASDRNAFNSLFSMLWEPMYVYAASLVMNDSLAKDLVQDIWIDYWQRRETVEVNHIKSYLFKAIRYKCYNTLRDTKFNKTQIEAANSIYIAPEMELEEDLMELTERIDVSMADLPQRCQEVFRLSRIHNISNKEIAERLNISHRSVENQISFALRRLRKDLSIVKSLFL